jgi:hypothetical protein
MSDRVRAYTRANIKSEPPSPYSLPTSMQTGSYFREEDLQASMAQQLSRTGFEVPQFPAGKLDPPRRNGCAYSNAALLDLSCGLVAPNPCMDFAAPNMHYDIQVVSEDGQVQPGAGQFICYIPPDAD